MKIGTEDRKKLIAAGSFGVLAIGYLVYTLVGSGGSDAPAPAPAAAVTSSSEAVPARTISPVATAHSVPSRLDPSLHPEAMLLTESLVYSGSGRNIFLPPGAVIATVSTAPKIPVPLASPRFTPPVNTGPAPPPPIDLRFFGTATRRDGVRQAFLLHGDDVFVASTGDVVSRRYRVGAITLSTVEVTDLTNSNTQRLTMSPQ